MRFCTRYSKISWKKIFGLPLATWIQLKTKTTKLTRRRRRRRRGRAVVVRVRLWIAGELRLGDVEARDEEVEQLLGRAETPVGREEGLHEHGVGVHVVGQPLHQLDEGGALDERDAGALLL